LMKHHFYFLETKVCEKGSAVAGSPENF
jgi:hypothetical protein